MTRHGLIALALALGGATALGGDAPAESAADRGTVEPLLLALDGVPTRATLEQALGRSARQVLVEIGQDVGAAPLARLQALTALAEYEDIGAETALRHQVESLRDFTAGQQTLYLRAAAISFARVGKARAVEPIAPLLDSPVPDVRADAAKALCLTGSTAALPYLRARLQREESLLVRVELVDAIRTLAE